MIVSVYQSDAFKEYCFPNTDNIDFSIMIEKSLFSADRNIRFDFENSDGRWYLRPRGKQQFSLEPDSNGLIELKDKLILDHAIEHGKTLRIICSDNKCGSPSFLKYDISGLNRITVGKDLENTFTYNFMDLISKNHCQLSERAGLWYLSDTSTNGVFVNCRRIKGEHLLGFGDDINIFGFHIVFLNGVIAVGSRCGSIKAAEDLEMFCGAQPCPQAKRQDEQLFNRSPRVIPHIYEEKIDIEGPPAIQTTKKQSLLQVIGPSFTMAIPMLLGCGLAIYNSRGSSTGGGFMYTGIITALGSALLGAFWGYRNVKNARKSALEDENKRFNVYSDYLIKMTDEIQDKYRSNIEAMNKTYPSAREVCGYNADSAVLWNRNFTHKDFLYHRLGLGERDFQCELSFPKEKFSVTYDSLQEKPVMLGKEYRKLYNVPVGIDMLSENLYGIVGSAGKIGAINVVYNIAAQIAANNCYTDVKMAFVYNEKSPSDRKNWNFLRWLPHVYSENRKIRFIASNKLEAADVFFELANVIRKRLDEQEGSKGMLHKPHYVIFIEDIKLLDGEPIMKYLLNDHNNYGVTTFILSDYYYNLPNVCENIIQNDEYGTFIYNAMDTENEKQKLTLDMITAEELEDFAKRISELRVPETESDSEIPARLTFMEMYGAVTLDELNVTERWRKNRTYNTMKSLVGKKAGGADCFLDIHEKYHGPHGLVAGTTGSGKSETLQTYILSLAINFSPDDVAFLIIDFKGGGMANLFCGLPHMAGQISNLSGNQINRAMVSIKSEIRRRQIIFSENSVNNINAYTNLFKAKETSAAVPHLLIIIDEFAELKREEPDFMRELISVAQVGRSLGIHLILATQKPGGTVDDNIWSNTKFRMCLRVQSRGDSMDMLHKPDAAYLTQAGRCYLQVGSDEIFELFQSGWSGAPYDPESAGNDAGAVTMLSLTGKAAIIGNRMKLKRHEAAKKRWIFALISEYDNVCRNYSEQLEMMDSFLAEELVEKVVNGLNEKGFRYGADSAERKALLDFFKMYDLEYSQLPVSEQTAERIIKSTGRLPELKEISQLDAVVDHLASVAAENGYSGTLSLWLPPLSERICLNEIEGYEEASFAVSKWQRVSQHWNVEAIVGLCDDPENQGQIPLVIDFAHNGHLAVIGTVVSGKSTFMQTLLFSLCDKYSPELINIYILDFSSRALSPFKKAPHCGGVLFDSDVEKVGKLFSMLGKMMLERKKLFDGGNYSQYVKAHGTVLPVVIVAIDNYAGFAEKTEGKFDQFILRLSREGVGFGIYLMISAAGFGMNEIPNRMADNFGSAVALNLGDKFKYMDILRTNAISMLPENNVKGRGLAWAGDRVLEYQAALAVDANDDYEKMQAMERYFDGMKEYWTGKCAPEIPEIPENAVQSMLEARTEYQNYCLDKRFIPMAWKLSDASVYSIDLSAVYCYVISGKQRTGKTNALKLIMSGASKKHAEIAVFEKGGDELKQLCSGCGGCYISTDTELFDYLSGLLPVFKERNQKKHKLMAEGMSESEIYEEMSKEKPYFIFINDLLSFFEAAYKPSGGTGSMGGFLENIIEKGSLHNIYIFGCADSDKTFEAAGYKAYGEFVKYKKGLHLGGNLSAQQIFSFQNIPYNELSHSDKKGIGVTPSDDDETQGIKLVVPFAGR